MVKVRPSQIDLRAKEGNRLAKLSQSMLHNLEAYLSATQLGITLASLGLGWIGESVVAEVLLAIMHQLGWVIAAETAHTVALFGLVCHHHGAAHRHRRAGPEGAGHSAARSGELAIARRCAFSTSSPTPLIWLLNKLSNGLLGLFGVKAAHGTTPTRPTSCAC